MHPRVSALIVLTGLLCGTASAAVPPWQPGQASTPAGLEPVTLPTLDVRKARAEDYAGKPYGDPPRVGLVAEVDGVSFGRGADDARRWDRLADGRLVWRLPISGPGALALDVSFTRLRLPAGAELWIRNADGSDWVGPYTDADNRAGGRFFTPMLAGSGVVIELLVEPARRDFVELELGGISRYYRDLFAASAQKSGSCNIDVVCPTGDRYREQIASVAHYSFREGGSTFVCTGQLAATTRPSVDLTQPTFLTAYHCVSEQAVAETMVFYWRYESPQCRPPGSPASGTALPRNSTTAATQNGASLLAAHRPSDVSVVRLASPVPAAAEARPTGWDSTGAVPGGGVTIHHPAGDEKRISVDEDPPTVTPSCILAGTASDTHWEVGNWEHGTTEGGSSGAGLWRPDSRRLIGVLSGGAASCTVNAHDCYGRLSVAWTGGGTPSTRVRDWLDPAGTGALVLDPGTTSSIELALTSAAFTTLAAAGQTIVIDAEASGGTEPYRYDWDIDGDGQFERTGSESRIELGFATRTSTQVTVRVTDADGVVAQTSRALDVRGPELVAEQAGEPVQQCGNDDATLDPGERWQLPVRLRNDGDAGLGAGHALFAAVADTAALPIGPNNYGYRAGTSAAGGCDYQFVDIASGPDAVAPLPVNDDDDGRTEQAIELGGDGLLLYGERQVRAVMSTNGYVSFSASETGADYDNTCNGPFDEGAAGPQLRPLHDDLVIGFSSGAGLRYRYFDACPRPAEVDPDAAQGCHVFQWTGMQRFAGGSSFEFQAIAYEQSGQVSYQYRTADPLTGGSATIGIIDAAAIDRLNVACNASGSATAQSAVCIHAPQALPASASNAALLPQAAQPLAALGAGSERVLQLPFAIDPAASCGASVTIDYIASAAAGVHSFDRQTLLAGTVAGDCQPVSGCDLVGPATSAREGLYFDPARDGNGINTVLVPQAGGRSIFGGLWYTGASDYTPAWYEVNGELYSLGGEVDVIRYSNPAAPGGFAPASQRVGTGWVGYGGDGSLLLAWDIEGVGSGAEQMQRVALPFAQPNHTAPWFNPGQNGWGLAIESLQVGSGELEFFAAYLYDADGEPRWVTGDLESVDGGSVPLRAYAPQCPGCPRFADVQQQVNNAGSLQIDYLSPTSAELTTDIALPAPWSGNWVRDSLPIVPIVPPSGAAAE